MSTRCQIAFEGTEVMIYKHSDGYPEEMLPVLEPFVKEFIEERGYDLEYLIAQVVRKFALEEQKDYEKIPSSNINKKYYKPSLTIGWGIGTEQYGDIGYLYTINKDGTIGTKET